MKAMKIVFAALVITLGLCSMTFAYVDIQQYPTEYFVENPANTYSSGYYRWWDEDWGWTHAALPEPTTSATLWISAWDVDAAYGEVDNIYALDGATWVLLGSLAGLNDDWGYTTFNLGGNFFDDIALGLQVRIDIDSTHSYDYWAVTLGKSILTTDGSSNPWNPVPGTPPVGTPEPTTLLLLGLGLVGVAGVKKALKK